MCLRLIAETDPRSIGDSHPFVTIRYKTMQAEIFVLLPPFLTFWGYIRHKCGKKKFEINSVWGKKAVWGNCHHGAPS